jgi:hypothetical protein
MMGSFDNSHSELTALKENVGFSSDIEDGLLFIINL